MNSIEEQPSKESLVVLAALKEAAINVLEKKRKLGHYAVIWENNQVVYKGDDVPQNLQKIEVPPHPRVAGAEFLENSEEDFLRETALL